MDALQVDIDNLEREKVDMKKRLDAYSKKSLLADLARHASSSSSIAAVVAGKNLFKDCKLSLGKYVEIPKVIKSVLNGFDLNTYTLGFHPCAQKLEPPCTAY